MKKILFLVSILFCQNYLAQKATENKPAYMVDTAILNELNLYMEGIKEKSIGNTIQALKYFNACIEKNQNNDGAQFEASRLEAELSNFQEAISKAEKAYSLKLTNEFYREHLISLLTKTGKLDRAMEVLEDYIKTKKSDDISKMQYAYLLSLNNKPKKALEILESLSSEENYNETISIEKIKIYADQKDFKSAENEMKKMIQNNPNDTRYLGNLAEFYLKTGQIDQAEKAYNDILRLEPNNVNALLYKVEYFQMKKDMVSYKQTLQNLMINKDLNLETKATLIAEKFATGAKIDSSEKEFLISIGRELIIQYPNDFKSFQILADMNYIHQQYDSARVYYKKSLAISGSEYNVWQNLFYTLSSLKKYQELVDSSVAALELFPANGLVHFYQGIAHVQLEKFDKAEKNFNRSLRFTGENKNLESQIYSSLGEVYHKQKKYKESDLNFESAIKLDPDNAYTLNNFAYYLSLRKDKLDYAKVMSKKSLDIDKTNPSFLDTYAWIQFQLENYTEAKYFQEQALENSKEDKSTIFEHLGDIYIKLNDTENALKFWNKARENQSKSKTLPNKILNKKYIEYQD